NTVPACRQARLRGCAALHAEAPSLDSVWYAHTARDAHARRASKKAASGCAAFCVHCDLTVLVLTFHRLKDA
ncbi:MAG: hypothetical protein ABW252_00800, partial [Polyangiales bacterium]